MNRIYLDNAATTPVDPRVLKAMMPYLSEEFGNPGSLHSFGQRASAAVFGARRTIADTLGAHYSEIIFTGSATEANNLAIRGAVRYFQKKNPNIKPRILISAVEHDCVIESAKGVAEYGAELIYIPVAKDGVVDVGAIKKNLNERTVLVSVMYANNETGAIQPIAEIAKLIRNVRGTDQWPLLHTDAVQAFQYLDCDINALGADMLTLSAHKLYGPKGIGALYVKNHALASRKPVHADDRYLLRPVIVGGGQEEGLRSGTENVASIVGFGEAVQLASAMREKEAKRLTSLRNDFIKKLKKMWPGMKVNGSMKERLANNINVYLPSRKAEEIIVALDLQGIAVSSGSACTARSPEPSRVLLAMGQTKECAKNGIRITLGRQTTKKEIDYVLKALKKLK